MKTPLTGLLLAAAMLPALAAAHVVTLVEPDPLQGILDAEPTQARPKAAPTTTEAECRLDEFAAAEGETLLGLIDALPVECMDDWFFDDMPVSRADIFSRDNMYYIIEFVLERAGEYDSAEGRSGLIGKSYVFLHAGWLNYRNHRCDCYINPFDISFAVLAFIESPHFQDGGDEHASMLMTTIMPLVNMSATDGDPYYDISQPDFYIPFAELFIGRVDAGAYVQSDAEWELLGEIDRVLLDEFRRAFFADYPGDFDALLIGLAKAGVDASISDRIANLSDEELTPQSMLFNITVWLAILTQPQRPGVMSAAQAEVRRFVNHWESAYRNSAIGRNKFYAAVAKPYYQHLLGHPHTADLMDELIQKILPDKYHCGRHVVYAWPGETNREVVCRTLAYQEAEFHAIFNTHEKPVLRDRGADHVKIFIPSRRLREVYRKCFPTFWIGVSGKAFTYGSGRRDALTSINISYVPAHVLEADNPKHRSLAILRHEFVHYLDSRYTGGIAFAGEPWVEGLATYVESETIADEVQALPETRTGARHHGLTLGGILDGSYDYTHTTGGPYTVGATAVRFLFEKHPEFVTEFLHYAYMEDRDGYLDYAQSIGSRYDGEFADWLENAANGDGPLPRMKRKTVDIAAAAVPLMLRAHDSTGQGFVRIINESDLSASVDIPAVDDGGNAGKLVGFLLGASQALHFNSNDLEQGNPSKGIHGSAGSPQKGDWRLGVEKRVFNDTDLGVRALSYVRTGDGFLTAMHDILQKDADGRLVAHTFNPGRNANQTSWLRLFNTGPADSVSIEGVDDQGNRAGPVTLTLPAGEARILTALWLENGTPLQTGRLGEGLGKWRLYIDAGHLVFGQSLLSSVSGHLTNLSTAGASGAERLAVIAAPLMLSASNSMGQGFVRIINETDQFGRVRILAVDDGGNAGEPVEIELEASQALHFNSVDLEQGNPSKGIYAGAGSPRKGDWRLSVETDLGVRVLSYVRTNDGFLTAMHDTMPRDADGRLAAQTFNPGSNANQVSKLRLVNTGGSAERVSIEGVDDQGRSAGPVTLTLAAGESRTLSASDLETGNAQGLTGGLGDGAGKWRLFITAGQSVYGLSLLEAVSGHLTNISTMGVATKVQ